MALDIDYSFLTRKDFSQAGRKLQLNKLQLFPWEPWEGIVSAAPAQANCPIEYCI